MPKTVRRLLVIEVEVDEQKLASRLGELVAETEVPGGLPRLLDDPGYALYDAVVNAADPGRYGIRIEAVGIRAGSFDTEGAVPWVRVPVLAEARAAAAAKGQLPQ